MGAKAETSAGMAYAERKTGKPALRAARNGQSAGGLISSLNDRKASAYQGGRRYSLAHCESNGISDLKSFTQDVWRASTSSELNGQLPTGASLYRVITEGGDTTQYIRTAASTASKCVTSGTYTTSKDGDTLIFDFPAGGGMNVYSTDGNGNVKENKYWEDAYTVNYKVSKAYKASQAFYILESGQYVKYGGTLYNYYEKSTLIVSGNDTGDGSATLKFTPKSSGGGTVKYTPSVAETVKAQKVGYYTRIPASAEEETKTFLTQGSTATQNFAFEIDE